MSKRLLFLLVALSPWILGLSSARYLVAVIACTIIPTLIVLLLLRLE